MHESPSSLQEVCLDYICDNIHDICQVASSAAAAADPSGESDKRCTSSNTATPSFPGEDVFFHSNLSDELLSMLSERNKLTDETLLLFDAHHTCLRRVKIKKANVSTKGLRVLKPHKIVELEAIGLKDVTVNDLVGCLGEWTLLNLRALNVAHSTFINTAKFCVVVSLSKLQSLQSLNVSHTEFNKQGLEIITHDLPALESLDISGTPISDLSPLRKCKDRLKSLTMYNLRASHSVEMVSLLCELSNLRHLDVSDDSSVHLFVSLQPTKFNARDLLTRTAALPQLSSLDISGKEGIDEDALREFVSQHTNLQFLGLALTDACELPMFTDPESEHYTADNIKVTGGATETQICEALRRYHNRPIFVQRSLFNLFSLTQEFTEPRLDIIKVILPAMRSHPKELGVQMAATACLYNLSKSEMGQKLHPKWLAQIVMVTMDAMQNFPNHQQLQKNALLTLCSDRILQDVTFDRFRCAELVMECLCTFDNSSMIRMSVAICGILAAKIPTEQTSQLGAKASYMKKLLSIVKEKTAVQAVDITMKFTLSALWNLTDESPSTCKMFLDEGGLDLFIDVLKTYAELGDESRVQVETKVLGLINNLAEVKTLRGTLMQDDIMVLIRGLLQSPHIDVSYFAAGIVSHLLSDGINTWSLTLTSRHDMLLHLGKAVLGWEQPQTEMVAYRSFLPFFPLLDHYDTPEVQLWAVWAMQHVCTKNGSRYCPMLVKEGGAAKLQQLVSSTAGHHGNHDDVRRLATNVLQLIAQEVGGSTTEWSH